MTTYMPGVGLRKGILYHLPSPPPAVTFHKSLSYLHLCPPSAEDTSPKKGERTEKNVVMI